LTPVASNRARPVQHLFRIEYNTGREKWIAIDTEGVSDLRIEKMKERIQNSEKRIKSGQIINLWYIGKLAYLKI
jgi:hypothetical protein